MSAYNDLVDSYYRAWFRFHPERAVDLGVEGYSHLLAPYGDDDIGALITLNEKLIDAVDAMDTSELDPDQLIDLRLMYGQAYLESKQLIELDWRLRDPTRFVPVNAIYQLTIRTVKDRCGALRARLQAIPGYLRGAKGHLLTAPENIPPIWLESAIFEAREGTTYLRGLNEHPLVKPCRLYAELEKAAHALDDFAHFLEQEIGNRAQGSFACGKSYFEARLTYLHGLDVGAQELNAFGQRLYDSVWQELQRVTVELQGHADVNELMRKIQRGHKVKQPLLDVYKKEMQSAHDFVKQHELVTLPKKTFLHVVETPKFLQNQIPFAAYVDPMPTDSAQTGYYYVTPPQDEDSRGEHNLVSIRHTCVHEAWPGHHLQFVSANLQPQASSLPRLINSSATMYEGWALYSEQLMCEQGFLAQPESRFILLKDRLWRALRVKLDVALHVEGVSLATASADMCGKLAFSHAQALGDLSWYTQSPTVPLGYATGWALINETRERLQTGQQGFSLKTFHDQLLSAGSIGLPWVLRRQFGEPLWHSVRAAVFG